MTGKQPVNKMCHGTPADPEQARIERLRKYGTGSRLGARRRQIRQKLKGIADKASKFDR